MWVGFTLRNKGVEVRYGFLLNFECGAWGVEGE